VQSVHIDSGSDVSTAAVLVWLVAFVRFQFSSAPSEIQLNSCDFSYGVYGKGKAKVKVMVKVKLHLK